MKTLITFAIMAAVAFASVSEAEAKGKKKSKPAPTPVVTVTPAPAPAPTPAPAPKPSFMDEQIAKALANKAPVGVTTYGAMAAAVAAGQNGGDPVAAAEAASAGW